MIARTNGSSWKKKEKGNGKREKGSTFPFPLYCLHTWIIDIERRKEGRKEREDWYLLWTLDSIAGLDLLVVVTVNVKGKSPHGQIFNLEASFAKRRKRTNNKNCFLSFLSGNNRIFMQP